jgi:serine-type D-Ala-D-Ala carboxypeptidase/endopeptidase (penicillin-binding protein 4)
MTNNNRSINAFFMMARCRVMKCTLLLAAIFCFPAFAQTPSMAPVTSLPAPVAKAIRNAGIAEGDVGIYVSEIDAKTPLLTSNASKAFNPASTMKIVTTFAAMSLLGADFRWKTNIYLRGPVRGDILDGDLIFRGSGDPKFVIEDLTELVSQLRAAGLREIRGDLILDNGYFDIGDSSVDAIDGDPSQPYNVLPSATLMNFKATKFVVSPNSANVITTDPVLADVQIINDINFVRGACVHRAAGLSIRDAGSEAQPAIRISGAYSIACGETAGFSATLNHRQFSQAFFKAAWQVSGGVFLGRARFERDAASKVKTPPFFTWVSPRSLIDVSRDINKFSNNVMARQLMLTTSAEILKLPATLDRARRTISTWLDRQGLNSSEFVIDNGSGLSRTERIAAFTLGRILNKAALSPYGEIFRESLPVVGVDGTMARRLENHPINGRAWIKTGSLKSVRTIAGYVDAASGKRYSVVLLVNSGNAENAQDLQDTLLRWVYSQG